MKSLWQFAVTAAAVAVFVGFRSQTSAPVTAESLNAWLTTLAGAWIWYWLRGEV